MFAMATGPIACPRCGTEVAPGARFCPSCGSATTRLSPGEVLDGKYEILDKLAEGGMGQVYRARHLHLDEIRIIKVTKADPLGEGPEPRRFQEEARIATLVRHPNVAALYDFSRLPDGSFYMVWEFIDGVTLEELLRRRGPMPVGRALGVARQVLAGLSEIHAQGIVHRDLAPDNIMIREGAGGRLQAKIIDLGIAKRVSAETATMTGTGMFLGKLRYCSPEQAGALGRGEAVDARSDIYSFGVVLYEMLMGAPPFEAETPEAYLGKHLHAAAPPLDTSKFPADLGGPLAAILKRSLEKNRGRRFASAEEFRQALAGLEATANLPTEAVRTTVLPESRRRFPVGTAVVLLIAAAAIAAYALVHRSAPAPLAAPSPSPPPATAAPLPSPTPAPVPAVDALDVSAPRIVEDATAESRASSRSVANPSEAGVIHNRATALPRPKPSATLPQPTPAPTAPVEQRSEGSDAQGTPRFRKFLNHWRTLPVERQAAQAVALARSANLFVATYPDDPLCGQLRRTLPRAFKDLALGELDERRPRIAARFYEAYRELDFAPADRDLDARFALVPKPQPTP